MAEALGATFEDPCVLPVALVQWAAVHALAGLAMAMAMASIPGTVWAATLDHLTTAMSSHPYAST